MTDKRFPPDAELYDFEEPHATGGVATVRISRKQIILYMQRWPIYRCMPEIILIEEFTNMYWALRVVEK